MTKPLFYLGNVTATAQVVSSLDEQTILAIVRRHAMGDWGDLCSEDRMSNIMAIEWGDRILSKYKLEQFGYEGLENVYVITEADRSYTTVMFVSEY